MNPVTSTFNNNTNRNILDQSVSESITPSLCSNDEISNSDILGNYLSIDDIIINLKIISKIKEDDKMIVNDKTMDVDSRNIQFVRRWLTSDNRETTINFITKIFNQSFIYYSKGERLKQEITNTLVQK